MLWAVAEGRSDKQRVKGTVTRTDALLDATFECSRRTPAGSFALLTILSDRLSSDSVIELDDLSRVVVLPPPVWYVETFISTCRSSYRLSQKDSLPVLSASGVKQKAGLLSSRRT